MKDRYFQYVNQILDFYNNQELSKGFNNNIFREDNSKAMVLPRLERAVKDAVEDSLLHSRYAIWASDVIDLIENAMEAIENQNSAEALRQLQLAANAVKAYKDIQIIFDDENFYKISDVFRSYASHLLSVDDRKSEIIARTEIIQRLKNYSQVSGAGLPRDIDFSIKNSVLKVFVKNVLHNMQTNGAAFEGWILILKSWLSKDIKYVVLDFNVPENLSGQYGNSEVCHYNRFLYRINNLLRLFPDWFFLHESKINMVNDFINWLTTGKCLLNHSLQERISVIGTDKMERQIESWFVFEEDGKNQLCKHWNIDKDKLFNQLPIGVFYKEIAAKNAIFTRGASAIDIWGIGNDQQTLHLIELKCGGNNGLGVISEILFYTAVLYDTCIADENIFSFGRYGKADDTTDMTAIKNGGSKFERLYAHILAEQFHPLFSDEVINLIQDGLSNLQINFNRALYDYKKKVLIG